MDDIAWTNCQQDGSILRAIDFQFARAHDLRYYCEKVVHLIVFLSLRAQNGILSHLNDVAISLRLASREALQVALVVVIAQVSIHELLERRLR